MSIEDERKEMIEMRKAIQACLDEPLTAGLDSATKSAQICLVIAPFLQAVPGVGVLVSIEDEARAEAERRWMPVLGYEGYYEVSDHGEVRRVMGGSGAKPGRNLQRQINTGGYSSVGLAKNGEHKTRSIHSLVLEAFVGPRPEGMHGCHNDGDRLNSQLSNLRWDTPSANSLDRRLHGTARSWMSDRDECRNGHPFTEANTYYRESGYRRCRACDRIAERARRTGSPRKACPECGLSITIPNLSRHIKKMHAFAALGGGDHE